METPQLSREKLGEESPPRKKIFSSSHTYMYTHAWVRVLICVSVCVYARVHVYIRIGPACKF